MAFEATPPTGNKFVLDAHPDVGGNNLGPTPMEALLGSLAACTAMDVVSILAKKRQKVEAYHLEIEGERTKEGEYPRPFMSFTIKHVLRGEGLSPEAVARAVELSDEKYCSVAATLRVQPKITTEWVIEEPAAL